MPPAENLANPSSSRRWKIIAPVAAVVVAAAAVGVYVATSGGSGSDGASSPQDAVRQAASAIADQNPDALVKIMNPGEVKSLGSLITLMRSKVSKTGAVSSSGPLEPWMTLTEKNLTMTTRSVNDEFTFVGITGGDVSATVDQAKMPDSIRPPHPKTVHESGSLAGATTVNHGKPFEIATIKVSGRWYISPSTTLFATGLTSNGLPEPDFSHPAALGGGSDTPGGVLAGFLTAIANENYTQAAGFISSTEVPALKYYYGALAPNIPSTGGQLSGLIPKLSTTVQDMSNGLKKVVIDSASIDSDTIKGSYNHGCVNSDELPSPLCIPSIFTKLSGIKDPFIVVEQNDGKWQMSPVATWLEYLRVVFTDGSTNAIYRAFSLEELTPVVATLHAGQSAQVKLNDAGFAHVHIVGREGDCIPIADSSDHEITPAGFGPFSVISEGFASSFGGSGDCAGWTIGSSGVFDGTVASNAQGDFGRTISIDLSSP